MFREMLVIRWFFCSKLATSIHNMAVTRITWISRAAYGLTGKRGSEEMSCRIEPLFLGVCCCYDDEY